MHGFMDFIRTQGVVGLAVGFILGGAVSKVVAALVTDVINPLSALRWVRPRAWKQPPWPWGQSKYCLGISSRW